MLCKKLFRLLVVVSLMVGLVGPAQVLLAHSVQAQDVHALAVALDDGPVSVTTANNVQTVTFPHTTGTGVNRLLVVGVSWNSSSVARTISSVTFTPDGGSALALTPVVTQQHGTNYRYAAIYGLVNPPPGQSGTVTVTFAGGTVTAGIVVGAANFAGVDQTTPFGVTGGAYSPSNNTTPTVTLTGLEGDELVIDTLFLGGNPPAAVQPDPSQTQLPGWNSTIGNARGAASIEQATSSSVTMSWTAASSSLWVIVAAAINPGFVGTTYDLTIAVDPPGSGTTVPSVGTHTYAENTVVNVTATPATGYEFDHWEGACTGSGTCQVTMDADKTVTAFFSAIPQYTLTVGVTGSGSVTLNPTGGTYYRDTVVTLTPVPGACHTFGDWSGPNAGELIDNGNGTWSITMTGNKSVTANFTALPQYTLTVDTAGNGTVTLNPAGGTYCTGTTVILTPVPGACNAFDGWSGPHAGDLTDNGNGTWSITMTANKSVTANFAPAPKPYLDGAVSTGTGAPNATSVSFAHTTGACTERLMLVGVSWNCGTTNRTISSITFTPAGGAALALSEVKTQLYSWTASGSTNYRYTAIYSLLDPPSGVAGTIDIAFSGQVSNGIIAGAANFAGVNQTTPLGTPDGAVGTGTSTSGTPNPAVTLTGLAGNELVFDSVFIGASSTAHLMTADAGQSELWNILGYTSGSSFNARGATSTKRATGPSVTMSWTTSGYGTTATRWAIAAVPINPAVGVTCYALTLGHTGNGTTPVATPPNSAGCDPGYYVAGETINLSGATPDTGWAIAGWYGTDNDGSTGNTNTVTMPAKDHSAGVNYGQTCYPLTVNHTGNGTTPTASPTNSTGCNPGSYHYGENITLSGAVPDTGWAIAGWYGTSNNGSTGNTNSLTMPPNAHSAGVNYVRVCYALTLGHTGSGTTPLATPPNSTDCAPGSYHYGEVIELSGATPALGWGIASWYGTDDDESTANTNTVTMPANARAAGVNYLRLLGDVNMDGAVNSTDALIVLTADAGLDATAHCPMNYGDVNGDGLVNSTDALIILTYDVGLPIGALPVGQPVTEPILSAQPPGCNITPGGLSRWFRLLRP